jgi:hypothetical protein
MRSAFSLYFLAGDSLSLAGWQKAAAYSYGTSMARSFACNVHLIVTDIEAARNRLRERGVRS